MDGANEYNRPKAKGVNHNTAHREHSQERLWEWLGQKQNGHRNKAHWSLKGFKKKTSRVERGGSHLHMGKGLIEIVLQDGANPLALLCAVMDSCDACTAPDLQHYGVFIQAIVQNSAEWNALCVPLRLTSEDMHSLGIESKQDFRGQTASLEWLSLEENTQTCKTASHPWTILKHSSFRSLSQCLQLWVRHCWVQSWCGTKNKCEINANSAVSVIRARWTSSAC